MKTATYCIQGTSPLLMHSESLANPFDARTKEIKAITGKRKKTEDDLLEIARLEWLGGLYYEPDTGIHMPGYNMLAALTAGAKLHKLGTAVKRSAVIQQDKLPLEFEGPKDPDALYLNKAFVDIRSVKVGTSKVTRCRPRFERWSLKFTVLYDEAGLQRNDLDRIVDDTGQMIGLGDYRPRFGRFEVVSAQ